MKEDTQEKRKTSIYPRRKRTEEGSAGEHKHLEIRWRRIQRKEGRKEGHFETGRIARRE